MLYKAGNEASDGAFRNLETVAQESADAPAFVADVNQVRDIHFCFNITTVPSLLIFEHQIPVSLVKGCNEPDFYRCLVENRFQQTIHKTEEKPVKRVTVYSTPTCS